jgi:hypothetical protein
MVASNKQPSGSKPGPGTAHTHAPNQGPKPLGSLGTTDGYSNGKSTAGHGTPKPVGNNKKNPLH